MLSFFVIFIAAALTLTVLRPPRAYRYIAWANLLLFVIVSVGFSYYTEFSDFQSDALKYYRLGGSRLASDLLTFTQANFVYYISINLQKYLPLNYYSFNLIGACLFSYVSVLLLLRASPTENKKVYILWWVLTLLPGWHLWNAAFGKDSMQLLFITIFLVANNNILKYLSLFLLALIRPHVAVVMVLAIFISSVLSKNLSPKVVALQIAAAFLFVLSVGVLMDRMGLQELSYSVVSESLDEYNSDWRAGALRNSYTNSPLAIIEFVFRPYIWESFNLRIFWAFVENSVLVVLLVYMMKSASKAQRRSVPFVFLIFMIVMLSFTNPNVGTAARKKSALPLIAIVFLLPAAYVGGNVGGRRNGRSGSLR